MMKEFLLKYELDRWSECWWTGSWVAEIILGQQGRTDHCCILAMLGGPVGEAKNGVKKQWNLEKVVKFFKCEEEMTKEKDKMWFGVTAPSITLIYSSRTASRIYISAEQHHPYILQQNSVAQVYFLAEQHRPGSGDPWEWRPVALHINGTNSCASTKGVFTKIIF